MNVELLRYEMRVKGVSLDQLCQSIGISRSAFYRKINGTSEFTLSEITKICEALALDSPVDIFFASKVS